MTQNEPLLVLLGMAKAFAFPLTAMLITGVIYGLTRKSSFWTSL